MTWLHRLVWTILAAATLAVVLAGHLMSFPEPRDAIVIDRGLFRTADGPYREVTLPPKISDRGIGAHHQRSSYLVRFDLAAVPEQPLFVLIPATSQDFSLALNNEPTYKSDVRAIWSEPMVRGASLVRLPRPLLRPGSNELSFAFEPSRAVIPNYLAKIYVGGESALAANFRLRVLFEDRLKTMALAAQALLGLGILIAFFYRPRDPLFSWLAATTLVTLVLSVGLFADIRTAPGFIRTYAVALAPSAGLLMIGIALAVIGIKPHRSLAAGAIIIPAASFLALLSGVVPGVAVTAVSLSGLGATYAVATGIFAWGAIWRSNVEARVMLLPMVLLCWFLVRDVGIALGILEGSILLAPYVRPLFLASILAILMRRLGMSLDRLDRANEELNQRLAEQEAELSVLHRQERNEATRIVREQERQRLTRDLHDGISGHLVSIIAMAERTESDFKSIEQAAREALDDLRLVIYSLDLGDRELPLALANFRERLIPQLRRIGVELEWSTASLPEVAGVTPGNALSILRILQEAITNALKHGPARRIVIRGAPAADETAAITIENDGRPFVAGAGGLGIENMRRRASQLGGTLDVQTLPDGVRVSLLLPRNLPDVQDAPVR